MINVDTVYKTVLLILNKEQRGTMTPDEFNKTATQVQLDIFERYFDDLSQQLKAPQSDHDYSNKWKNVDECLAPFKVTGDCSYSSSSGLFNLPLSVSGIGGRDIQYSAIPAGDTTSNYYFYKLGTPVFTDPESAQVTELELVTRKEYYALQRSDIPSKTSPIFMYEGHKLHVSPSSIQDNVSTSFI